MQLRHLRIQAPSGGTYAPGTFVASPYAKYGQPGEGMYYGVHFNVYTAVEDAARSLDENWDNADFDTWVYDVGATTSEELGIWSERFHDLFGMYYGEIIDERDAWVDENSQRLSDECQALINENKPTGDDLKKLCDEYNSKIREYSSVDYVEYYHRFIENR